MAKSFFQTVLDDLMGRKRKRPPQQVSPVVRPPGPGGESGRGGFVGFSSATPRKTTSTGTPRAPARPRAVAEFGGPTPQPRAKRRTGLGAVVQKIQGMSDHEKLALGVLAVGALSVLGSDDAEPDGLESLRARVDEQQRFGLPAVFEGAPWARSEDDEEPMAMAEPEVTEENPSAEPEALALCDDFEEAETVLEARRETGVEPQNVLVVERAVPGPPGPPGRDGVDGTDGRDGADGRDGTDGRDGRDGTDGRDGSGRDGRDGADGRDGCDGSGRDERRSAVDSEKAEKPTASTRGSATASVMTGSADTALRARVGKAAKRAGVPYKEWVARYGLNPSPPGLPKGAAKKA